MNIVLLLAANLLGQTSTGSFEFRNETNGQEVWVWIWNQKGGYWENGKKPVNLRANKATAKALNPGNYRLIFESKANASTYIDRTLSASEVDRITIREKNPGASSQFQVFAVEDEYGNYQEAQSREKMEPPPR